MGGAQPSVAASTDGADSGSTAGRSSAWPWAVALVTLAGAVPRLLAARDSLAWDELYLYSWVHGRGLGAILDTVSAREKTPPLGFVLAWLADQAGGSPQLIRTPALIAGIAIVPLTAILARQGFGRAAGLVAASLAAASPFLLFYSVEARSYSLATAFCLVSTVSLLRALRQGGIGWWIGFSAASAAALMSHYTAAGLLAAQFAWALIAFPRSRRQTLIAQAGPVIAALAWLPGLIDQVRISSDELARINAVAPLATDTVATIVGRNLLGHPLTGLDRIPGSPGTWLVVAGAAIAAVFAIVRSVQWLGQVSDVNTGRPRPRAKTWLLAANALAAPAVAIVLSAQPHQSMLFARNLMVSLPAALVLAAALLVRPPLIAAIASSLLVIAGLAAGSVIELVDAPRPAARSAALAVSERWRPGDRIIELCCLTGADGPLGTAVALNLPPDRRRSLAVLSRSGDRPYFESLRSGGRVFVIGYVPEGSDRQLFLSPPPAWSADFRPVWQRRWPGILETVATEYAKVDGRAGADGR